MKGTFPPQSLAQVPLGARARDRLSGFEGIVEAHTIWLNGCERVTLLPPVDNDGKLRERESFDVEQVQVLDAAPFAPKPVERRTNGPMPTLSPR